MTITKVNCFPRSFSEETGLTACFNSRHSQQAPPLTGPQAPSSLFSSLDDVALSYSVTHTQPNGQILTITETASPSIAPMQTQLPPGVVTITKSLPPTYLTVTQKGGAVTTITAMGGHATPTTASAQILTLTVVSPLSPGPMAQLNHFSG